MDTGRAADFLRAHHRAVLATSRSDGMPQLSPVTCTVDDDGRVLISTRETAVKTKNLRRRPRASLCVFTDTFFGEWVQVEGDAEVISLPDAMDLLVEYYRRRPTFRSINGAQPPDNVAADLAAAIAAAGNGSIPQRMSR